MNTDFRPGFSDGFLFCAVFLSGFIILANGEAWIECGTRSVTVKTSQSRIVGGRDAVEGAWPWQVSLQATNKHAHMCGATVISQWWLLSAAHCFPRTNGYDNKNAWRAVMGLREQGNPDRWTIARKIDTLILHENYNSIHDDVAVLKVDRAIRFGDYIRPACLPKPGKFHIDKWKLCHVTGWGLMEHNGAPAHVLQEAGVKLIPLETCQQSNWYGHHVTNKMICAGFAGGGIDACQGDSGGPLSCQLKDSDRFYIVGIVNWGEGCAQRFKPGVYASTSAYGDWIEQKTGISISQSGDASVQYMNDNSGAGAGNSAEDKPPLSSITDEGIENNEAATPASMVCRNSPGRTIHLLNLLIVLYRYHFCTSYCS
ncbi:LOW QUALITY PROTEIN: acrosin-like [Heptranchias perlo]|uniref:LOW QUALITY PROTEIN: acrosin-like n=1 Tax=Heptranchias perlo TaxID=212740 RepID=UPI00355A26CE